MIGNDLTILIGDLWSQVDGGYNPDVYRMQTSFPVEGAFFTTTFQKKRGWDGRKSLAHKNMFPTGLLPQVFSAFSLYHRVSLLDYRSAAPVLKHHLHDIQLAGIKLAPHQKRLIEAILYPPVNSLYQLDNETADFLHPKSPRFRLDHSGIWHAATNSGKTEAAIALILCYGVPKSLWLVPGNDLVVQTKERFETRLCQYLADNGKTVGYAAEGKFVDGDVVIAGLDTLQSALRNEKYQDAAADAIRNTKILIADECHRTAADTYYDLLMGCPARVRVAMSGTPLERNDGTDLRTISAFGEVVGHVSNAELIRMGWSAETEIRFIPIHEPQLPYDMAYGEAYRRGVVENDVVLREIVDRFAESIAAGQPVITMVEKRKHGKTITDALRARDIDCAYVDGRDKLDKRTKILNDFKSGKLMALVSSNIFATGIDFPGVDVLRLINAAGQKSKILTLQRTGRGLRAGKLMYYEFAYMKVQKHLTNHSLNRLRTLMGERAFSIFTDQPQRELGL